MSACRNRPCQPRENRLERAGAPPRADGHGGGNRVGSIISGKTDAERRQQSREAGNGGGASKGAPTEALQGERTEAGKGWPANGEGQCESG